MTTPIYNPSDTAVMKKAHPCGSSKWLILRTGADIKIKCMGCGHIVMMTRAEFNKKLKAVETNGETP
ncbi:MAG: DUF951 domain-containing protein [Eubacteriaceae bacterium]|nr:DUF951 domain-containing protein [Eubacteriaceae bacterium]